MSKIKRFVFAILMLAVISAAFTAAVLLNPAWLFYALTGRSGRSAAGDTPGGERVNLVLLGFDRSAARDEIYTIYRPDTIMLASFDLRARQLSLANISRDSYVKIAGTEIYDKINHAYMYGYKAAGGGDPHQNGIETTRQTIEDFLGGVPVHYYAAVDMDAVIEIVDRAGGIEYTVEQPVRAGLGRGKVLVEPGKRLLDGEKFLHYVRDRSVGGDTARSRRQQQILIVALAQLKERLRPGDIPSLWRSLRDRVETDLPPHRAALLALWGLSIDPAEIKTYLFPGQISLLPRDGVAVSYIIVDEAKRVELIREIFGVQVERRA